jgi:hypothetical protein
MGGWQGAALGYFLLVSSRVATVDGSHIVRTILVAAISAALAVILAANRPRIYGGVVFAWAAGLPFACYLLVEVFLTTPAGASGWSEGAGAEGESLRAIVDWILSLSPGTAAVASLHGELPSGSRFGWWETGVFAVLGVAISAFALWRIRAPSEAGRTPSGSPQ